MTDYTRGRSPSAGDRSHAISRSPSSHNQAFNPQANALGLDPSLSAPQTSLDPSLYPPQQQHQRQPQFANQNHLFPVQNDFQQGEFQDHNQQFQANLSPGSLDFIPNQQDFDLGASLDLGQDPAQLQNMIALQQQQQHLFPTNNFGHLENMSPTSMQNGNGRHSRNQSLDPNAAYLGPQNNDWTGMQFMGHRHQPSDGAFSDVSSQHSPYMANENSFDGLGSNSPLMNGQDPTTSNNALGIEQFPLNINDHQFNSPNHSAQPSPRISPHQTMPPYLSTENLVLSEFPGNQAPDVDLSPSAFPPMMQPSMSRDSNGLESTMSPPQINIVTAPPENQLKMNPEMEQSMLSGDALSPPGRSGRLRQRAISESGIPPGTHRAPSPMHQRSGSVGLRPPQSSSRSTSPNGGIHKMRRNSTPDRHWALDLAERQAAQQAGVNGSAPVSVYQANPQGVHASTGSDSNRRVQKHPATFQCHLCPKRFTRAYNLRSHLRTHTDERPFVCSVCGKAFARQHDRKRHEGLHSGEKKFVCKGLLQSAGGQAQQTWGCGRRFARADALGRHFRSEAGRACIKPLLDEEARERRAAAMEQANQDMINGVNGGLMPQAQFNQPDYSMDSSTFAGMALPAALLQQYPALADIQWNAVPGPGQDDGEIGDGRSNYDVSSGGEFDEEDETGYVSGPVEVSGCHNRLRASFSQNGGWTSDSGF